MGRHNPLQLPYLLNRADAGGYVYRRVVPAALRQRLGLTLALDWHLENKHVTGVAVIKIALKTHDSMTAKARWSQVHIQIEAAIAAASRSRKQATASISDVEMIQGLSPSQILGMAAQVEAAVYRENEVQQMVLTRQRPVHFQSNPDMMSEEDLAWRQAVNASFFDTERNVTIGLKALIDKDYTTVLDNLWPDTDAFPLPSQRIRERLGMLGIRFDLETRVLAFNGVMLPQDHPDRQLLTARFAETIVKAHKVCVANRLGDFDQVMNTEINAIPNLPIKANTATISVALANWLAASRPTPKTKSDAVTCSPCFPPVISSVHPLEMDHAEQSIH